MHCTLSPGYSPHRRSHRLGVVEPVAATMNNMRAFSEGELLREIADKECTEAHCCSTHCRPP